MGKEKFAPTSSTPGSPASAPPETLIRNSFTIGLQTPILDKYTFQQCVDFAAQYRFKGGLEVAAWPPGQKPVRRYSGICHIDASKVLDPKNGPAYVEEILAYAAEHGVPLASLLYCGNPLANDADAEWLILVIRAAAKLNVRYVTSFTGRVQTMNLEDSFALFQKKFKRIIEEAERHDVVICIEPCPMSFTAAEAPYGQNLLASPKLWERAFEIFDSPNFGLCYDPSHSVLLQYDAIAPIYDFKNKIHLFHAKDLALHRDKLNKCGIFAYPLDFVSPCLPPFGDVNWKAFFNALHDINFTGNVALEFEDRRFENNDDITIQALLTAKRYLEQFTL